MKLAADYRALARDALRGRWKTAVLAGLLASALGANIVNATENITSNANRANQNSNITPGGSLELFSQANGGRLLAVLVVCIVVWTLFTLVVGGAVRLGYARFNLNLADGKAAAVSDLFSQKGRLWDGFCLKFLQGLYVALWSLLLVIPGIVKSYSYAMAPYIMAEHPALTANEAITESRRIMDGNKWRLFCLDFSFIGWAAFSDAAAMGVALVTLLAVPLSAGFFVVRPYEEAAWAVFYRDITAAEAETE